MKHPHHLLQSCCVTDLTTLLHSDSYWHSSEMDLAKGKYNLEFNNLFESNVIMKRMMRKYRGELSHIISKPTCYICKNKDAALTAQLISTFVFTTQIV